MPPGGAWLGPQAACVGIPPGGAWVSTFTGP